MDRPFYPRKILPKRSHINRINIEEINKLKHCILVRRSDLDVDQLFDEDTNILKEDAIDFSEAPNLSMNLLGGKFNLNHLRYRCFKRGMADWKKVNRVKLRKFVFNKDYQKLGKGLPVFFKLSHLHNKTFEYPYKGENRDANKIISRFNLNPRVNGIGNFIFEGRTLVIHAPNMLNYWHVMLEIKDIEQKVVKGSKSKTQEAIAKQVLSDILTISAFRKLKKINRIPLAYCYSKTLE